MKKSVRITKILTFDAGHRLSNYEGKCHRLHGHTYKLEISIQGRINNQGMIVDFSDLVAIFRRKIEAKFDHKMILFKRDMVNKRIAESTPKDEEWIVWVNYNPTAENLAIDIHNMLSQEFKNSGVKIICVKLWETPTAFAEVCTK